MSLKDIGNQVLLIGKTEGHIDQSLFARVILDEKKGPPPEVNLFNEKNNGETLLNLIEKNYIKSVDHYFLIFFLFFVTFLVTFFFFLGVTFLGVSSGWYELG